MSFLSGTLSGYQGAAGGVSPNQQVPAAGYAEFVNTANVNSAVGSGVPFTIPLAAVVSSGNIVTTQTAVNGTVFTLASGTYAIDYECSLAAAGSIGIVQGATFNALSLNNNTVAGSTAVTTWIHGRCLLSVVSGVNNVIALAPALGPATVVSAGNMGSLYIVRVTFNKLS